MVEQLSRENSVENTPASDVAGPGSSWGRPEWALVAAGASALAAAYVLGQLCGPWSVSLIAYRMVVQAASAPILLYVLPVCAAVGAFVAMIRPAVSNAEPGLGAALRFIVVASLVVITCRWPLLALHEQTVDESIDIATALTLTTDPVYWRSADVVNRGPMNPFFLASFSLVGLKLDYGAAKLAVLVLSTMLWVPLYLLARTWFSELSARTSVVPLVFFIALLRDSTLLAFNVEYIVWVLLIGSVWMIANAERRSTSSGRRTFLVLGGALLGLVPFAKLQGAPIAIGLGMCALYWILRSRPASSAIDLLCLGAGSIVPSVMSAVVLIPRGLLHDAVHRMIVSQIEYARSAGGGFGERTAVFVRGWFTTDRMVDHQLSWMALLLVGASLGVLYFMWRSRRVSADPDAGAHDAGRSNRWIRIGLPTSLSTIVVACLVVWHVRSRSPRSGSHRCINGSL
jgi:hypothetical protein